MKLTSKQVFMVILGVGLVGCLLVYNMVFNKYNALTEELEKSNAELQTKVDEMKQYYDQIPVYRAEVTEMLAEINELTADYPSDAQEEDVIMMAVDMQNAATVNFEGITIAFPDSLHTIPQETVAAAGAENLSEQIEFVGRQATYTNSTDYGNLKNCIAKVYDSPYRVAINAISYKKDSPANKVIKGTIDITYYSVKGMGKDYTIPDMPAYLSGAPELFGIISYEAESGENTPAEETAE